MDIDQDLQAQIKKLIKLMLYNIYILKKNSKKNKKYNKIIINKTF